MEGGARDEIQKDHGGGVAFEPQRKEEKPGEEQELGVENLVCLESCCKGGGEDGAAPGPAV